MHVPLSLYIRFSVNYYMGFTKNGKADSVLKKTTERKAGIDIVWGWSDGRTLYSEMGGKISTGLSY